MTITMLGAPVPWARTAGGRSTHLFTPTKQRKNAETLATIAQREMQGQTPFDGPVQIDMLAVFEIPKSWSKKKQHAAQLGEVRPTRRPDGSNLQKQIEDAFNGVVFMDDSQIVEWRGRKVYGLAPKIVVTIANVELGQ